MVGAGASRSAMSIGLLLPVMMAKKLCSAANDAMIWCSWFVAIFSFLFDLKT